MKLSGVIEIVYILFRAGKTYVYPFIKTHESVHIESLNSTLYK